MTSGIPRFPLILGLLGTLPFIFGCLATLFPQALADLVNGPVFVTGIFAGAILNVYGTVILAFMSGVLWGFATIAPPQTAAKYFLLSVIPAILVLFYGVYSFVAPMMGLGHASLMPLVAGFIALLGLDYMFWAAKLAPDWWMRMRTLITVIVVLCLSLGEFAA